MTDTGFHRPPFTPPPPATIDRAAWSALKSLIAARKAAAQEKLNG